MLAAGLVRTADPRAFDRIVADYHTGSELELPVSVKVAAGRKAA